MKSNPGPTRNGKEFEVSVKKDNLNNQKFLAGLVEN